MQEMNSDTIRIWEEDIYSKDKNIVRYPYDSVVAFLFKNYPRNKERNDIRILEVGSGTGNNLWFAAREGFSVTGIEGSATAVEYARKRFKDENLEGEFIVGDFTKIPFPDNSFDIVIDRGSVSYVNFHLAKETIREIKRVLLNQGVFYFTPYSERNSLFASGKLGEDGMIHNSDGGPSGSHTMCFYGKNNIFDVLEKGWEIKSITHKSFEDVTLPAVRIHAEWEVVAINNKTQ